MTLELASVRTRVDPRVEEAEVYARLIAMAAVGVEEAIGMQVVGGLVNLVAREMLKICTPPKAMQDIIRWLNEETPFRIDTYNPPGGLIRKEDGEAFYLIARECPVRQILYFEDLPYGRALCRIMCTCLEKLIASALGGRYRVMLDRPGPNACLLRVKVLSGPAPPNDLVVVSRKPSREEYIEQLMKAYSAMIKGISRALYLTLGGNVAMSYRAGKQYGRRVGAHILAEGYEPENIEEAIDIMNVGLKNILKTRLDGDYLVIEWSRFDEIVEKEGLQHPEFIKRLVQGFVAGVLETLTGMKVDLRSTSEPNKYKLMVRNDAQA